MTEAARGDVTIGVISDTHGLLRNEAVTALQGCACIVHAGDVGKREVLEGLHALAPQLVAICGNVDAKWQHRLPARAEFRVAGLRIFVLHDLSTLGLDPVRRRLDVIISGHSHQPRIERRDGVLYVNPGSAGPRRFRLPVSVARIHVRDDAVEAEIVMLQPNSPGRTVAGRARNQIARTR